jgi:hypothetical protein
MSINARLASRYDWLLMVDEPTAARNSVAGGNYVVN